MCVYVYINTHICVYIHTICIPSKIKSQRYLAILCSAPELGEFVGIYSFKWFIFYEKFNRWDYIYICVYAHIHMHVCTYVYIYTRTHTVQIFLKDMENFALLRGDEWGMSFSMPQSQLLPALPHLFSGTPSSPALSTQGWLFWGGRVGKAALTQLPAQSWLNVLFPISGISPVAS